MLIPIRQYLKLAMPVNWGPKVFKPVNASQEEADKAYKRLFDSHRDLPKPVDGNGDLRSLRDLERIVLANYSESKILTSSNLSADEADSIYWHFPIEDVPYLRYNVHTDINPNDKRNPVAPGKTSLGTQIGQSVSRYQDHIGGSDPGRDSLLYSSDVNRGIFAEKFLGDNAFVANLKDVPDDLSDDDITFYDRVWDNFYNTLTPDQKRNTDPTYTGTTRDPNPLDITDLITVFILAYNRKESNTRKINLMNYMKWINIGPSNDPAFNRNNGVIRGKRGWKNPSWDVGTSQNPGMRLNPAPTSISIVDEYGYYCILFNGQLSNGPRTLEKSREHNSEFVGSDPEGDSEIDKHLIADELLQRSAYLKNLLVHPYNTHEKINLPFNSVEDVANWLHFGALRDFPEFTQALEFAKNLVNVPLKSEPVKQVSEKSGPTLPSPYRHRLGDLTV